MRTSSLALAFLFSIGYSQAEISFDLRETISGHSSMVLKARERTSQVFISGGKIARVDGDFNRIVDNENNQVTLIDHRERKFAVAPLDEKTRSHLGGFDNLPMGVRVDLVSAGTPSEWSGVKTKRDTIRILITGEPGPGEWLLETDVAETLPGFETSKQKLDSSEDRKDVEIEAMISTLAVVKLDTLKDLLKTRKRQTPGIPVRTKAQFKLQPGSPILATLGPGILNQALMVFESEVVNPASTAIDANIFLVPRDYEKAEYQDLARDQAVRANQ